LPSTHPIAAEIPDLAAVEVNFDGITYAKGASVLKQLVAYVGLEHFLAGLRDYFRTHAFGNATFTDLLSALVKASGRDLSNWGQQWLKTTGLNTLRPDFDVDTDGKFTRFAVTQSGAAPGAGETRVHRVAIGIYDDDGSGKLVRVHREELDIDGPETEVPALVGVSRGKLILVNDDDLTYCSLRLDAESLRTALERIADIAEPLPRTLVWSAAWEMTREAELRARDFVALVSGGIHAETEVGVAQRLLLQAQTAVGSYAEPGWAREHGWPQYADRLLELARAAAPASDHQLAFVNTLCSSVLSPRHVETLSALLDGDPVELGLAGVNVDTDLRWRIVSALAAAGAIDGDGRRHRGSTLRRNATRPPPANGTAPRPRRHDRNSTSRNRRSPWWSRTTPWPTSPPVRSSRASPHPAKVSCSSRSPRATSRRSLGSGRADPARSRRPW
jgi:aminopeptidase N